MEKLQETSGLDNTAMVVVEPEQETRSPFILGNTREIGLTELGDMLTPVFSRDNVETISHTEAISTVMDAVSTFFDGEEIKSPVVRVSHEMKLRNRFGMGKLVENLTPEDSDSYWQRAMAMIEIHLPRHQRKQMQPPGLYCEELCRLQPLRQLITEADLQAGCRFSEYRMHQRNGLYRWSEPVHQGNQYSRLLQVLHRAFQAVQL